jgi:putative transposase
LNRIKIAGIKRHLVVRGLKQVKDHYDIANAKLLLKPSGFYIMLTCFEFIKPEMLIKKGEDVGIDFGIKNNVTTSNGEVFNVNIGETERLKLLQKKLSRQVKSSNNTYKTKLLIQQEYEKLTNKKVDKANKIVSFLLTKYNIVYMQEEQLKKWHRDYGKQVQHSCMGTIKSKLRMSKSIRMIDKWYPSTKLCYVCGKKNEISLLQRVYQCECGLIEDRDVKAAKTIMYAGQRENSYVPHKVRAPMESRELKLAENDASNISTAVDISSIVR